MWVKSQKQLEVFRYHFSLPNTDSDTWNSCILTNPVCYAVDVLEACCLWILATCAVKNLFSSIQAFLLYYLSERCIDLCTYWYPIQHVIQYGGHFQYWYRHWNNTKNNRSDISYNTSQWHLLKVTLLKAHTFCRLFKEKSLLFKLWKAPQEPQKTLTVITDWVKATPDE